MTLSKLFFIYNQVEIYFILFKDVDECSNGSACGENAYCVNNDGSFWCLCEPGYNGNPLEKCEGKMAIL